MNHLKTLFLPNWKVSKVNEPASTQFPADYQAHGKPYWFFKYIDGYDVDIIDISSIRFIESFERNKIRFYLIQAVKAYFYKSQYDLIISHGMQSGIAFALLRRIFRKGHAKHIVIDIGAFNSAQEKGLALKVMKFASRSIDGVIYHTSKQKEYYQRQFPWLIEKSEFITFGTIPEFYETAPQKTADVPYIICVGSAKRDWKTLIEAFTKINTNVRLKLIGKSDIKSSDPRIEITGTIPVERLMEIINGSMFCVLPLEDLNYSFGQMTLLQQMAQRKAVIAARVPSMIDYVKDNETALLYEPGNTDDLRKQIMKLITSESLRKKISQAGYESVRKYYHEKDMALKISKFAISVCKAA